MERFRRRLTAHLRRTLGERLVALPEKTAPLGELDDAELAPLVAASVKRAQAYGLESAVSVTAFAAWRFAVAPNFDAWPLFRHVLTDSAIAPDRRLDALLEIADPHDWIGAERGYDPADWRTPE